MSWLKQAYILFEAMDRHKRELERKDLELRLGMTGPMASKVLMRLVAANCIRRTHGSARTGVFYEFVVGSRLPEDGRVHNRPPKKQLQLRASRPPSARWRPDVPMVLSKPLRQRAAMPPNELSRWKRGD